jgi:hypothetical protein
VTTPAAAKTPLPTKFAVAEKHTGHFSDARLEIGRLKAKELKITKITLIVGERKGFPAAIHWGCQSAFKSARTEFFNVRYNLALQM